MEEWLSTDEIQEAVSCLEMATECLGRVSEDVFRWRWVLVALHAALQGFMVAVLRGTNNLLAMPDKLAGKWLEAHYADLPTPDDRLDSFPSLFKKVQSERMRFYTMSRPLQPTASQRRSVTRLNSLRNDFAHFVPRCWALEISGLPLIVVDCLDVIEFLAYHSGNILWSRDECRSRTEAALARGRRLAIGLAARLEPTGSEASHSDATD